MALIVTLYTNPLTIVPLYLLAYAYGRLLLPGEQGPFIAPFAMDWSDLPGSLRALGEWMLALGKPLGVGLLALGLTLAAIGYVAMRLGWRALGGRRLARARAGAATRAHDARGIRRGLPGRAACACTSTATPPRASSPAAPCCRS